MNEWQEQGLWIPRNICLTCARSSLWQLWGYTNKCWNEAWLIDQRGWRRMFTDCNEGPDNKWLCVSMEGQINGKSCDSKPWLATPGSPTRTNQAVGHLNRSLQSTFQMSSQNVMQSRGRDRYNSLVHGNRQQMWVGSQGGKLADISSLISCVVSIISPPSVSLVSWMHVCVSANLTVFAGDNEELGLDLYFLLWTVFGGVCPRGPALDLIPRLGIRLRMYNVNVVIITHVLSKPNVWTRILNQNCSISITSCLLVTRFIHATVCGCGGQL